MLNFKLVARCSNRLMRSLIGLEKAEFAALLPAFAAEYQKNQTNWSQVKVRTRKSGAGRLPAFSIYEDAMLFILIYFKAYPTQDLQALFFGCTQSWACKWIHRLTPVLEAALGSKKSLPKRVKRISTIEEFVKEYPELSFIIDGMERKTRRPKNPVKQKQQYSGKKKRHTIKNTILSDAISKKVIAIGSTFGGSVHDKTMIDTEPIVFPRGATLFQDTGYQGYLPEGVSVYQPIKKRRGKPRAPSEKLHNRKISRIRVRVEHTISGIKRSGIVSRTYRNRRKGFEDLSVIVAGYITFVLRCVLKFNGLSL